MTQPREELDSIISNLNVTNKVLAEELGISAKSFSNKLNSDNFSIEETSKLVEILYRKYGEDYVDGFLTCGEGASFVEDLKHFQSLHEFTMASIGRELGYDSRYISKTFNVNRGSSEETKEGLLKEIKEYLKEILTVEVDTVEESGTCCGGCGGTGHGEEEEYYDETYESSVDLTREPVRDGFFTRLLKAVFRIINRV